MKTDEEQSTADESPTTGRTKPKGLQCSGCGRPLHPTERNWTIIRTDDQGRNTGKTGEAVEKATVAPPRLCKECRERFETTSKILGLTEMIGTVEVM